MINLFQKTKVNFFSIFRALISAYLKIPVDIGREHMQYTRVRINGYSMFKLVYSKKKNVFFVVMLHFYISQMI